MSRAGIFVGVNRAGDLQQLQDAAAGARRMYEWALAQGMPDETHAKLITDEGGKVVEPDDIRRAIKAICGGAGVEQLIIYFAGHGISKRGDRWLLSDAANSTSAAVNVSGSVALARHCGIPHVVFISDACRVPPEGVTYQNVEGIDVFPNTAAGDRARPVDEFFACYLGRTAAEVKDALDATKYSALYTDAMLEALRGNKVEVLQQTPGDDAWYVRPWPLHDYLVREIPQRVKALKLQNKVNQNPDSIITSRESWIARLSEPQAVTRTGRPGANQPASPPTAPPGPPAPNLSSVSRDLTRSASKGNQDDVATRLRDAVDSQVPGANALANTITRVAEPFGPDHFETQCGIKIRGARVVEFFAPLARGELLGDAGEVVRISNLKRPAASVLLRLEDGRACVIPAIMDFVAAATFDKEDLIDVAYEPSANSWRWPIYEEKAAELRSLRAVASSASQYGRFRLAPDDASDVGRKMQLAKGIDPTMAIYAAYAYHDVDASERIQRMSDYLRGDVGSTFFDLELLGRRLLGKTVNRSDDIVPFMPLLTQGWSLLRANRVQLHPALNGIEKHLLDSLWTLFDKRGAERLKEAMQTREVL